MSQRLLIPGSNNGIWGDILDGFFEAPLKSDGTWALASDSDVSITLHNNNQAIIYSNIDIFWNFVALSGGY